MNISSSEESNFNVCHLNYLMLQIHLRCNEVNGSLTDVFSKILLFY